MTDRQVGVQLERVEDQLELNPRYNELNTSPTQLNHQPEQPNPEFGKLELLSGCPS